MLVFVATYLFLYFWQFLHSDIFGYDGFYHIKYAYLLRKGQLFSEFPWAQFSIWREHFADKEFLFHVLLIPFTYTQDLMVGGKHAAVFFSSVMITSFFLILRLNNVPWRYLWLVLLLAGGEIFYFRLLFPRPHLLAVTMIMWIAHSMLNKNYRLLAVACSLYIFSYTAIHMATILALVVCAAKWLQGEEKVDTKPLMIVVFLTVFFSLLSPFFPDNLILFYQQNIKFTMHRLFSDVNLFQGTELQPMFTTDFIYLQASLIVPLAIALYLSLCKPRPLSTQTKQLLVIVSVYFFFTLNSKRFVEYLLPLGLMFCAFYFRDYFKDKIPLKSKRAIIVFACCALLIGFNASRNFKILYEIVPKSKPSFFRGSADYIKKNVPQDETLFTCDWDDAPELFFYNHNNKYMIFLEPFYFYVWRPDLWRLWNGVARGEFGEKTAEIIVSTFKLHYGVCTNDFGHFKALIEEDPNSHILYQDEFAYVFHADSNQRHQPEDQPENQ